jgi:hypothetical protein
MLGTLEQRHVGSVRVSAGHRTDARLGGRLSAACVATGLAALAVGAPPVAAHPDTIAEAQSLCGLGYSIVGDPHGTPARRKVKTSSGVVYGHVYLTYNPGTSRRPPRCVLAN